jgi:hypothetical protein
MKKIIILFFVLFAATENYGQFSIGPKIGYSTSKLSTDFDDIKESAKNNFQIGAFMRFGKKLYLQPEAFYATSGGILKHEDTGLEESIKLKNLCVPVLVGFKLINAKVFNLRLLAGPSANFILNKEFDSDNLNLIQEPLQDSNFKNIAWGMDVGAGVDIFFLTLDLRYEFGLNNLYIPPDGGDPQKISSNVFIVSLGFKLL